MQPCSQILTLILELMEREQRQGPSITLQRLIKHLTLYFMISKHSVQLEWAFGVLRILK